jgi:hypothetical protein
MRFTLNIDTDNAAFEDPYELPAALGRVIQKLEAGADSGKVLDSNGNTVGSWSIHDNEVQS